MGAVLVLQRLHRAEDAPLPRDEVPATMCLRCGLRGQHRDSADCIAALRDRIADLEFARGAAHGTKASVIMRARHKSSSRANSAFVMIASML